MIEIELLVLFAVSGGLIMTAMLVWMNRSKGVKKLVDKIEHNDAKQKAREEQEREELRKTFVEERKRRHGL